MKTTKTLLSVLLALTLVFALAVPACADGTITVSDPGTYTYTAYKIFDAKEESGAVSYTLAADSEWKSVLLEGDGAEAHSKFPGLTFEYHPEDTGTSTPAYYSVTRGNTFSAADFAEFLRGESDANLTGKTGEALSGTPVQASVDPGYYLVISKDGTDNQPKAALATVLDGENVNIQNKNDMPFDKTVDGEKEESVQLGQTVNYKLTGKVPADIDSYTTYLYLVSDKMDSGLTFNKDVAVTIGGTAVTLEESTDPSEILTGNKIRYAPYANGKDFELSLDLIGKTANAPIEITYSAVVNENAAGTVSENNAVLEYGNNPQDLTVKDSQTKVYTTKLIIDKFETGAQEQKLSGAEFVLRKKTTKNYFHYNDATKTVSWVVVDPDAVSDLVTAADGGTITKVTTDDNGAASFNGLPDGEYELIEIAAPAGYTRIESPISVTIDGSDATAVGLTNAQITQALTDVVNVSNTPGTNLPSTGGIGTTIFYIAGSVLILGAILVLVIRKRKGADV